MSVMVWESSSSSR